MPNTDEQQIEAELTKTEIGPDVDDLRTCLESGLYSSLSSSEKKAAVSEAIELFLPAIDHAFGIDTLVTVAKAGYRSNQARDEKGRWTKSADAQRLIHQDPKIRAQARQLVHDQTQIIRQETWAHEATIKAGKSRGFSDEQKAALKAVRSERSKITRQANKRALSINRTFPPTTIMKDLAGKEWEVQFANVPKEDRKKALSDISNMFKFTGKIEIPHPGQGNDGTRPPTVRWDQKEKKWRN